MTTDSTLSTLTKASMFLNLTREQAIEEGLAEPTSEEVVELRARRIEDAKRYAAERAVERAAAGRPVTREDLLEQLGWSEAYAEHRVHPGCTCTPGYDGDSDYLCSWAEDLGFTTTRDTPDPMTAEQVEAKAAQRLQETIEMYERWDGKPFRLRDLFPMSFVTLKPITYGVHE